MNCRDWDLTTSSSNGESSMSHKVDRFGAVASSFCAVHCALCALLPAAFSALGLGFLLGHEAEWAFTLIAVGLGTGALILGWRQHRSTKVASILALGIVGLLASRGLEMGSDHHGHHEETHHADAEHKDGEADHGDEKNKPEEHRDERGEEHHEEGGEHDDAGHLVGALVGVLAGLLLFWGHLLNIRTTRKCQTECSLQT